MDDQSGVRLERIEEKLDKMSEAIISLARMEERMITLFKRMDDYDHKQGKMEDRVVKVELAQAAALWIERAIWILAAAAISAAISFLSK